MLKSLGVFLAPDDILLLELEAFTIIESETSKVLEYKQKVESKKGKK